MDIREITDRQTWERFWESHTSSALFQSWLWGDVMLKRGVPIERFGLWDKAKLVAIFQVMTVSARRGRYLHVRHGPVLITQLAAYWRQILEFLREKAREEHAWFIRLSPQMDDTPDHRDLLKTIGLLPSFTHEVDAERCVVLPLGGEEEQILAGMRKTTRYEIRRAPALGVRVDASVDPVRLESFFSLYAQTSRRHHFVVHKGIREEFEVFVREGKAVLLLGYVHEALMSAAIILFSGSEAIYHHGASIPTKIPVNYALQWEAIRLAKEHRATTYNFWGVSPLGDDAHPWSGHSLFKRGFGGKEIVRIHAHDAPVSPLYWATRTVEWWEEKRRGY